MLTKSHTRADGLHYPQPLHFSNAFVAFIHCRSVTFCDMPHDAHKLWRRRERIHYTTAFTCSLGGYKKAAPWACSFPDPLLLAPTHNYHNPTISTPSANNHTQPSNQATTMPDSKENKPKDKSSSKPKEKPSNSSKGSKNIGEAMGKAKGGTPFKPPKGWSSG